MIQSRTEMMNHFACNYRKSQGWIRITSDLENVLKCLLKICKNFKPVWIIFDKCLNFSVKSFDGFLGAIQFGTAAI